MVALPGHRGERSQPGAIPRSWIRHDSHTRHRSKAPTRPPQNDITNRTKEDEAIVTVPLKAMLTIERVPASFTSRFPAGTPVHAIVAAFLTNGNAEDLSPYELWRKTWPSRQDFEDSMPILWPSSLRVPGGQASGATVLPPSISGAWNTITKRKLEHEYETPHQNLLPQQEKRLQQAWDSVVAVFPDTDWESFSYHWLIVNTRCFYYLMPGEEPPEDSNDAMAMLPFADYFNHSDVAVWMMLWV